MSLVLDAGALVAIERGDTFATTLISAELAAGRVPLSHGGVVGQVWRGGGTRQARLARLLAALEIAPLDEALGRRAGALLARARKSDVVDAALVLLAADGDYILTSDPNDLGPLAFAAGLQVEIIPV
jgi:predicted nucleic acid-binding protein